MLLQTQSSVTTRSTQDLAAPLSQVLSNGTQRSVYGAPAERLFAQQGSSARTWYSTDALGSVRATLNDAGIPQAAASYDAWGVPETPLIASFGFTGELQQGSDVWLRARWYGAGRGSFGSRDPFEGMAQTPYSLQYYQYGYSNPVSNRDPSGQWVPDDRRPLPSQVGPCSVEERYVPSLGCVVPGQVVPDDHAFTNLLKEHIHCLQEASKQPIDAGIIIGVGFSAAGGLGGAASIEVVIDLYDFESDVFVYRGLAGGFGYSISAYVGFITGWSTFKNTLGVQNYAGSAGSFGIGLGTVSLQVLLGGQTINPGDNSIARLVGGTVGVGFSDGIELPPHLQKAFVAGGGSFGGSSGKSFSSEEVLNFLGIYGRSLKKTYHSGGWHKPTHSDAALFSLEVMQLGYGLGMQMQSIINYNRLIWQGKQNI